MYIGHGHCLFKKYVGEIATNYFKQISQFSAFLGRSSRGAQLIDGITIVRLDELGTSVPEQAG